MKKVALVSFVGVAAIAFAVYAKDMEGVPNTTQSVTPVTNSQTTTTTPAVTQRDLQVPHIWEIPDGIWVSPWSNACEEASIIMAEEFYLNPNRGEVNIGPAETKKKLTPLFGFQNNIWGSNGDSDSKRTARIINDFTMMDAVIKENPTVEDIKAELDNGHPVLSFHYGRDLKNPEHRYRADGSAFHVMLITGYNDKNQEFLVNDTEMKTGLDYRYKYDIIMSSLHDFDHKRLKADGTPVVIFTRPKELVKNQQTGAIYLIRDGKKHYIANPRVFGNRRLSWSAVKPVSTEYLDQFEAGETITK